MLGLSHEDQRARRHPSLFSGHYPSRMKYSYNIAASLALHAPQILLFKHLRALRKRSSVPPPQRLPGLPLLSSLRLLPPPSVLNVCQLLILCRLDLRCTAAQTHKERRAFKLLCQSYSGPPPWVFGAQPTDVFHLFGFQMILLLVYGSDGCRQS